MDRPLLVLSNVIEVDDPLGGSLKVDRLPLAIIREDGVLHVYNNNSNLPKRGRLYSLLN
jgi:hypothetical protein